MSNQPEQELSGPSIEERGDVRLAITIQAGLLLIAVLVAFASIFAYSGIASSMCLGETVGLLTLYSAAAGLAGGFFGFLFGVPRSAAISQVDSPKADGSTSRTAVYVSNVTGDSTAPNTNLEQISDWLTKILVGATLTQLGNIPAGASTVFTQMASALGNPPPGSAAAFCGALVIYCSLAGFMIGWLTSRVWLGPIILLISGFFRRLLSHTDSQQDAKGQQEVPPTSSKSLAPDDPPQADEHGSTVSHQAP